ncbi:MAG: hypothetical protein IJ617_10290 [Oscillospiraceae bacterium]|nr:hypothetical protein [Oscillospiraceae bacterium]
MGNKLFRPEGPEYEAPQCPVCLAETDSVYVDGDGEIHGCDGCLKRRDAWELLPERGRRVIL